MATITPPATFAQVTTDLGLPYVFAEQAIRRELADMLNVLQMGVVPLVGDAAGTGSDTIRVTRIGGVGWSEAMATMGTETAAITPTGFTTGFDLVAIARHGMSKEESYTAQILGREPEAMLEGLKGQLPNSWLKTFRQKVATAGAGITDSVGTIGTAWTFDDELDLVAYFNETEGSSGAAVTMRHPEQYTQLRNSIQDVPNFQFPEITTALQGLRAGGNFVDFLGFRNFSTHDITDSGGDHQGFAFEDGAIGWARASTMNVKVEDPDVALFIPEFGLVCEWKSAGRSATAQWDANAYFGVALADPSIAPQVRIVSVNTP
jgi:hypothetical protein